MDAKLIKILENVTASGNDRKTWAEWKNLLSASGFHITSDDSGMPEDGLMAAKQVKMTVPEMCMFHLHPPLNSDISKRNLEEELSHPAYSRYLKHFFSHPDRSDYEDALKEAETRSDFEAALESIIANGGVATIEDHKPKAPVAQEPVPAVPEPVPAVPEPVPAVSEPVPAVSEPVPAAQYTVAEWRRAYARVSREAPIGRHVRTIDGSPIRIDVHYEGWQWVNGIRKQVPLEYPIMSTRLYLPTRVCGPVEWFAQGESDIVRTGWYVILLDKYRDQAMRKFDLEKDYGFVDEIYITRLSGTKTSLLCQVTQWE